MEELLKVLYKKATGYKTKEVQEEFVNDTNGNLELVKRKISTKHIPPDISAVKVLIDMENGNEFTKLSDAELEEEKQKIILAIMEERKQKKAVLNEQKNQKTVTIQNKRI